MIINDLTKGELILLLVKQGLNRLITPHSIKMVRWETMTHKAKIMVEEAVAAMEIYKGPQNWTKYKEAHAKFDRAMKLYDEADKILEAE